MDEEYLKPYKKAQAVEEQIEFDSLMDYYRDRYKREYYTSPIFNNEAHGRTLIKDLKRLMGIKSRDVITTYFEMKDDWFVKQMHSLDCLLRNLNKVNSVLEKKTGTVQSGNSRRIRMTMSCDSCWKQFEYVRDWKEDFTTKPVFCNACGSGAKTRTVTRDQARLAFMKMGQNFSKK